MGRPLPQRDKQGIHLLRPSYPGFSPLLQSRHGAFPLEDFPAGLSRFFCPAAQAAYSGPRVACTHETGKHGISVGRPSVCTAICHAASAACHSGHPDLPRAVRPVRARPGTLIKTSPRERRRRPLRPQPQARSPAQRPSDGMLFYSLRYSYALQTLKIAPCGLFFRFPTKTGQAALIKSHCAGPYATVSISEALPMGAYPPLLLSRAQHAGHL